MALPLMDAGTWRIALQYQSQTIKRRYYHLGCVHKEDDVNIKLLRHDMKNYRTR
jgi:hypothetical protein